MKLWHAPQPAMSVVTGGPQLWVPLADEEVSNVATYEASWEQEFATVLIRLYNVVPVDNVRTAFLKTSSDGGSTFDGGASDYQYEYTMRSSGMAHANSTGTTRVSLNHNGASNDLSNAAGKGMSGTIQIFNPSEAKHTNIFGNLSYFNAANTIATLDVQASRLSSGVVNAVQIFIGVGNISTGRFQVWGLLPHGEGS